MYGLINKAVEDLVRRKFGDAAWDRIRARAGLTDEPFISMQQYDDTVTETLVAAASAELGAPPEAILEEFGAFWVRYTSESVYGELMKTAGRTLPEFLRNLDQIHTRIKLSFPHLQPPSFLVRDETATSLSLHYFSERKGLSPLVVGLLKGLAERFDLQVSIEQRRVDGPTPHDVFDLRWTEATA
jgi:hypothetical protein